MSSDFARVSQDSTTAKTAVEHKSRWKRFRFSKAEAMEKRVDRRESRVADFPGRRTEEATQSHFGKRYPHIGSRPSPSSISTNSYTLEISYVRFMQDFAGSK